MLTISALIPPKYYRLFTIVINFFTIKQYLLTTHYSPTFEIHTLSFDSAIVSLTAMPDLCCMKSPKVWLILGAADGLGPPAVKYLLANQQLVITIDTSTAIPAPAALIDAVKPYGQIDFIINNANYRLFGKNNPDLDAHVAATMAALKTLRPYLKKQPAGSIINIPPQLCLATMADEVAGNELLRKMDTFLTTLRRQLRTLDCDLRFLEPGERLL